MKSANTDNSVIYGLLLILNFLILPFFLTPELKYQNYLLAFLLAASSAYFFFQLKKEPTSVAHELSKVDWLWLLCILGFSGLLGALQISDNSLWLDEWREFRNILRKDVLWQAAMFQQPPLAYFFRKAGVLIGGKTEFGIRISSLIGNALFLIVMYLNIRKLTKDSTYAFLSILLLGFNYWIILYSVEARPYSISLFYFAVFLYFLISEFTESRSSRTLNYGLVFATVFWLLSISMQPLLFVGWATAAALLSWLVSRNTKFLGVAAGFAVALLLYLPFLTLIVESSQSYIQTSSKSLAIFLQSVYRDLYIIKSMYLNNFYYHVISLQMFLLTFISLVAPKNHKLRLRALTAFSIIYVVIIVLLFEYKIDWTFSPRYLITTVPLFYLLFFAAFFYFRKTKFILIKKVVLAQLVIVAATSYLYKKPFQHIKAGWRELYYTMEDVSPRSAKAFIFSFTTTNIGWSDEFFVAPEIYSSPNHSFSETNKFRFPTYINNDFLFENFANENNADNLFFVIWRWSFHESIFEKLNIKNTAKFSVEDFFIIKATPPKNLLTLTKEFYSQIETITDNTEVKLRAYDGLFMVALYERNCVDLRKYFEKYTEIAEGKWEFSERTKLHTRRYHSRCVQKKLVPENI